MKKNLVFLTAIFICMTLFACATGGPKYTEMQSTIPQIAPDQGRIYFYRHANFIGAAIQPDILLNGEKVGESVPGGFFYVDVKPGDCEVLCSTEVERKLSFTLDNQQTRFVRTKVGMGVLVYRVYPELVEPSDGMNEIKELTYQAPKREK